MAKVGRFRRRLGRAWQPVTRFFRIWRAEGTRSALGRMARGAYRQWFYSAPELLVAIEDAASVDWTVPPPFAEPITVTEGPVEIAWITSPPGQESGGHQNMFRFIKFAEDAGHRCSVYFYRAHGAPVNIPAFRESLESSEAYPKLNADFSSYDRDKGVDSRTQAIFATGWETAYPAYLDASRARRFYFVQDFEPSFYPLGSSSLLAENTYRFGFHGITAGKWLAAKLHDEYQMTTDHFDFAVDRSLYTMTNLERRNEIFFYARPSTPRRAFEFGLMALEEFARLRPDVVINFAGWDVSNWKIPFKHENLASLELSQLNVVYNRCVAGLVMSLSNMSLLPLELIACGVTPVINDGPNNRMVSDNKYIEFVPASPKHIAQRLAEVVERPDAPQRSIAMADSVSSVSWEDSSTQFLGAFERAMRG